MVWNSKLIMFLALLLLQSADSLLTYAALQGNPTAVGESNSVVRFVFEQHGLLAGIWIVWLSKLTLSALAVRFVRYRLVYLVVAVYLMVVGWNIFVFVRS